jgi:hypothetical protein
MKKAIFILALIVLIPVSSFAQTLENLDYVSSFNDDLAAISKDGQWAFINNEGDIVVNYRNDLVTTKSSDGDYPVFRDERCLIVNENDGISYFGYIDTSGDTVIEPQFLNALNFDDNLARVLKLRKDIVGRNTALDKNVVYYKYFEVTIDRDGNVKDYLTQKGVNIVLDKKFLPNPPEFSSKQISDNLVATRNEKGKWTIKKIIQ